MTEASATPVRRGRSAAIGRRLGRLVSPFRVELRWWAVGSVLVFILGVALVAESDDPSNGAGVLVARIGLCLVGGWGLARWFVGDPPRARRLGWGATALLLVFVLLPSAGAVVRALVPHAFGFGTTERLMVFPALVAVVLVVCRALALHQGVSRVAAALVALSFVFVDSWSAYPGDVVSTATTAQLLHSRDEGVPVLVRGTNFEAGEDTISGVRPSQAPRDCQSLRFTDRRHSLVGVAGRRIGITFDACWTKTREPLSLVVTADQEQGDQPGGLVPVRLVPGSPFGYENGQPLLPERSADTDRADDPQALRYGDRGSDLSDDRQASFGPVKLRDDQGRVRTDGRTENDVVVARVLDRGNRIQVVLAFESEDLFLRSSKSGDGGTVDRIAGAAPGRGVALDVVTASLYLLGGSSARLTRITADGEIDD